MRTILLTPGPLTTSDATRAAMSRDWGSRDQDFIDLSEGVRRRLGALVNAGDTHVVVPIQGAGTYAVEAAIGTLVPRDGRLLVLVNGAYGRRAAEMAERMGRSVATLECPEDQAVDPARVAAALRDDPAVTDVLLVHLETTSGLLNPLDAVAAVVAQAGRRLLLDAMSALGAVPIDLAATPVAAVMASANKGLEGVPGLAYVIAEAGHLDAMRGNSHSTSLDLQAQWAGFEANRQWRFTPPTHVVAALSAALDQLDAEGGIAARAARYRGHMTALVVGMRQLGFAPYLPDALQGPVILTLREPPGFDFAALYQDLHRQGIVLYPGKLTREASFRIGCIGAITLADIERTLAAIGAWLQRHAQAAD
ncbi:MAG: 2-aminoethylphosphonate--pyruvate transaminase [Janthinobacterium lividum]